LDVQYVVCYCFLLFIGNSYHISSS